MKEGDAPAAEIEDAESQIVLKSRSQVPAVAIVAQLKAALDTFEVTGFNSRETTRADTPV